MPARKSRTSLPSRPRVRRGNEGDADQLRRDLLNEALKLFAEGGLEAVTVRAVASRVGVSTMTPYRYFADKAELLVGLWWCSLEEAFAAMKAAVARQPDADARTRLHASIDAYLHYWETHPDHFRLVYMTEQTTHRDSRALLTSVPVYADIMADSHQMSCDLAAQIGVAPTHAKLASDVRLMMGIGYLYSMLVNQRYPWSDRDALRAAMIDNIVAAMERCLLSGAPAPAASPA